MPKMKMKQIQAMNNIILASSYQEYCNLCDFCDLDYPSYNDYLKNVKVHIEKNMKVMKEGNNNER